MPIGPHVSSIVSHLSFSGCSTCHILVVPHVVFLEFYVSYACWSTCQFHTISRVSLGCPHVVFMCYTRCLPKLHVSISDQPTFPFLYDTRYFLDVTVPYHTRHIEIFIIEHQMMIQCNYFPQWIPERIFGCRLEEGGE